MTRPISELREALERITSADLRTDTGDPLILRDSLDELEQLRAQVATLTRERDEARADYLRECNELTEKSAPSPPSPRAQRRADERDG